MDTEHNSTNTDNFDPAFEFDPWSRRNRGYCDERTVVPAKGDTVATASGAVAFTSDADEQDADQASSADPCVDHQSSDSASNQSGVGDDDELAKRSGKALGRSSEKVLCEGTT